MKEEQEAREMSELNRMAGEQQSRLPEALVPSLVIGMEGLAEMGKEVEDELDEDDEDDDDDEVRQIKSVDNSQMTKIYLLFIVNNL